MSDSGPGKRQNGSFSAPRNCVQEELLRYNFSKECFFFSGLLSDPPSNGSQKLGFIQMVVFIIMVIGLKVSTVCHSNLKRKYL